MFSASEIVSKEIFSFFFLAFGKKMVSKAAVSDQRGAALRRRAAFNEP